MSEKEAKAVKLLDTKLDKKLIKTLTVCTVIMLIAILIHDGDHIRQAYNWGYTIHCIAERYAATGRCCSHAAASAKQQCFSR
ncbi:MAG: hypothetical protein SPF50_08505 [Oscillospiraceae bacterium]|nr:hypothetical protein [Oscillospiraceae bacterium]